MLAHSFVATVTNSYLNVRTGPGTDYSWISSLGYQDKVEILAVEVVDHVVWGRFYGGWISLQYTDFDESKLEDPSLIIYAPVRVLGNKTIVTNGDQTDTIYELMDKQQTFDWQLIVIQNCTNINLKYEIFVIIGKSPTSP